MLDIQRIFQTLQPELEMACSLADLTGPFTFTPQAAELLDAALTEAATLAALSPRGSLFLRDLLVTATSGQGEYFVRVGRLALAADGSLMNQPSLCVLGEASRRCTCGSPVTREGHVDTNMQIPGASAQQLSQYAACPER